MAPRRRWIDVLFARLRAFTRARQAERDLHDELSFHLAMETQANLQGGVPDSEARRRARIAIDGVAAALRRGRAMTSQPKIARPRRGDRNFGRLRRGFSLTMRSGIARSARLAAASNLGSPDVHLILRRPLSPDYS